MADGSQDQTAQEPGAICVALSPVQLAAIMGSASLSQSETLSNRIWGGVGLVGGTLELLGSAALLVDPDPTVSKVVGVVGIVHVGLRVRTVTVVLNKTTLGGRLGMC